MNEVLALAATGWVAVGGVLRAAPNRSVVAGLGAISEDNRRVVTPGACTRFDHHALSAFRRSGTNILSARKIGQTTKTHYRAGSEARSW